ncbi:MAG: nucleolar RNA-binding Nop10p family protein [Candidatus Micrarchaeota archaeon]
MNLKKIKKCSSCGSYTMMSEHCKEPTVTAHPPKYSPEDKYSRYRRIEKGFEKATG